MLLHIQNENRRDSMIFIAEVGQIPETNAGAVSRHLLRINNDPEGSNDMTLSDNAERDNATTGYQLSLRFLKIDKFEEFLKIFLDQMDS
jgi:hypothetical protein